MHQKRYAALRQVYYSLILAQWFKSKNKDNIRHGIDQKDLTGLTSKEPWSKSTYFNAYRKSFSKGEYSKEETSQTQKGLIIRQYFSGGVIMNGGGIIAFPAVIKDFFARTLINPRTGRAEFEATVFPSQAPCADSATYDRDNTKDKIVLNVRKLAQSLNYMDLQLPEDITIDELKILEHDFTEGLNARLQAGINRENRKATLFVLAMVIPGFFWGGFQNALFNHPQEPVHMQKSVPEITAPSANDIVALSESVIAMQDTYKAHGYPIDEKYYQSGKEYSDSPQVTVRDHQLYIGKELYQIRGLAVSNVPSGSNRVDLVLDGKHLSEEDLYAWQAAGVNTIRTYYTPTLDYLDKCAEHNIRVAVGIPYYDDRTHPGPDIKSGSYLGYVAAIKDHPAVAFILLGNEYNYHPEWFEGDINNWYSSQAKAVDLIKMVDSKHPVGTVHGGVPKKELLEGFYKNVDIIAINDYAFRASDIGYDVRWLHDNTPPKQAIMIAETNWDSYNAATGKIDEHAQAEGLRDILDVIGANNEYCPNIFIFSDKDEDWKQEVGASAPFASIRISLDTLFHDKVNVVFERLGIYPRMNPTHISAPGPDATYNERYFGIRNINGVPKESYYVVQAHWGNKDVIPVENDKALEQGTTQQDGGTTHDDLGGIDFRELPTVGQAQEWSPMTSRLMQELQQLAGGSDIKDLSKEWSNIQEQIRTRTVPCARIKEFYAVCCLRNDAQYKQEVISCIIDLLRYEEEAGVNTSAGIKDLLVCLG